MKILLIEDDPETAGHICHALRAHGHEVEESRNGPDGLASARGGQHAALIVDRMLPGLDGLGLVRQLRTEGCQTPVLFLTTMSGIDDRVVLGVPRSQRDLGHRGVSRSDSLAGHGQVHRQVHGRGPRGGQVERGAVRRREVQRRPRGGGEVAGQVGAVGHEAAP